MPISPLMCGWSGAHTHHSPPRGSVFDVAPITFDLAAGFIDTNGCTFRQLFQDVPSVAWAYPFAAEHRFNAIPMVNAAGRYWGAAWAICVLYLALCYLGGKAMTARAPFGLQRALVVWNLGLAAFSLLGFLRTAPHLLFYLWRNGFYASVCAPAEPAFGHGAVGLWTFLFIFSKVPELGDTAFVVLRKKPLIFLHWYHHVTVLLYCWHSYKSRSSAGLWFVSMNYGVHALMYFYYCLAAMRIHPPWAPLVTALQISQMFVGIGICVAVAVFAQLGWDCDVSRENYAVGLLMYGSYAALFLVFAFGRYCRVRPRASAGGGGKAAPPLAVASSSGAPAAAGSAAGTPTSASSSGASGVLRPQPSQPLRRRAA